MRVRMFTFVKKTKQSHYHTIKEGKTKSSSSQHQGNSQDKWIRQVSFQLQREETDTHFLLFSFRVKEHQVSYDYCIHPETHIQITPGVSKRWQLMPPLTLHVHSGISQLSRFFLPCLRNSCRSESPLNYSNRPGSTKIPKDSRAIAAGCFAGNAQTQTKLSSFSQVLADSERLTAQSQVKAEHTVANSSS